MCHTSVHFPGSSHCLVPCRYVLTQFNSHTLNTHIAANYPPVVFGGPQKRGFVDVLTASQTPKSANWYKGSADAVRQQLDSILDAFRGMDLPDELLVLSGQALYRMVSHTLLFRAVHCWTGLCCAALRWQHLAQSLGKLATRHCLFTFPTQAFYYC